MEHGIRGTAHISKNLKQPGLESLSLLVPRQRAVQANERLLHHVLGVIRTPQHRAREPQTPLMICLHDCRERVDIAELGAAENRRVEDGCLRWSGALQEYERVVDLD